jgi:CRP/FNR family cyclic AMP-dependent transcriptional regulator
VRALLQNVPIFAGLEENALNLLLDRALETDAPAGTLMVCEGELGNRFYLIASGSVRVCKNFGQSHQVDLATLGPGEFFGEMCILETLPRSATVQAITDTVTVSLSSMAFYRLYTKMPDQYSILVLNIARDVSRRLRHLDEIFAARH